MTVNVGILSSTTFSGAGTIGADFAASFTAGFTAQFGSAPSAATSSPQEANGKYDSSGKLRKQLYDGVDVMCSGANAANIIVAVGGLVSAHAAVVRAKVPFVVLIGRIPDASDFTLGDNEHYCGGIDLHTVHNNMDRRDALLTNFNTLAATDIWLLYNPNSRMGESEANEWRTQGGHAIAAAVPGLNDATEFGPAFTRLKNHQAKGIIISADPFFSSHRTELVTAANNAATAAGGSMKICYPSEIFGNKQNSRPTATVVPTTGSGISIGPNLLDAYVSLGVKAGAIAALLNAGNSAAFQGLDTSKLLTNPIVY
jgi:hypothetical protein